MVFHRDGRVFSFETDGLWFEPAEVPFMALGSGSKAALGALHMGADAVRAVEVASLADAYTGGPIITLRVADIWADRHEAGSFDAHARLEALRLNVVAIGSRHDAVTV